MGRSGCERHRLPDILHSTISKKHKPRSLPFLCLGIGMGINPLDPKVISAYQKAMSKTLIYRGDIEETFREMLSKSVFNQTSIAEKACENCGGNIMTKYKYGIPDIAC